LSTDTIFIIIIACLVVLSAYFSATETAYTSINRIKIKNLAQKNKKARLTMKISEDFDKLLSTILIGNNIVNIVLTSIATLLFVKAMGEVGATWATVVVTVVILVFGEISPKSLAKEAPERWALTAAPILRIFMIVLTPLTAIFSVWKKILSKIIKIKADKGLTDAELITLVEEAETDGYIDEDSSELIQNAIYFRDLEANDILTPRVDIVAVSTETSKEEIASIFKYTGFSRVPVYTEGEGMDNIIGVLNQKDFHNYISGTDEEIGAYIKPAAFAPGTMKIANILKAMQDVKTHIAIIVDEYGGTMGLITMEDIIEELVGEIYDEHDAEVEAEIRLQADGTYNVDCSANIVDVFDFFDIKEDIEVNTVNGLVLLALGAMPKVGDSFEYIADRTRLKIKVIKADDKKANEINLGVEKIPLEEEK